MQSRLSFVRKRKESDKVEETKKVIRPMIRRKVVVGSSYKNHIEKIFQMPLRDSEMTSPVSIYSSMFVENENVELLPMMEPCPNDGFTLLRQTKPIVRDLVRFYPRFLSASLRSELYEQLRRHSAWKRYERPSPDPRQSPVQQPRYQIGFLKAGKTGTYTYSNFSLPTHPYVPSIEKLDVELKAKLDFHCEFILANLYEPAHCKNPIDPHKPRPDKDDCIAIHSDQEVGLDHSKPILSISVGDTRRFVMRLKKEWAPAAWTESQLIVLDILLTHGSVLEMLPGCQSVLTHEIPRRTQKELISMPSTFGSRINLTARILKPFSHVSK